MKRWLCLLMTAALCAAAATATAEETVIYWTAKDALRRIALPM